MKILSKISFVFLVLLMMGGCGASEAKMSVEPALADEDPITVTQEKAAAEKQPAEERPSIEKSRTAQIDQATQEKPTEDLQQNAAIQQAVDAKQTAQEKPTEEKQQTAQEKPVEDKQQTAVNQQAANQTAVDEKPQQEQDTQEYENRVLASVDGRELLAWQANLLLERGFAGDLPGAVQIWINIQTKAAEVRRMGLDKTKENAFTLQFRTDFDLSSYFLDMYFRDNLPQPEEELIRLEYDKNINNFQSPMKADIQHISVMQRDLAEKIFSEAENKEVSFDVLVEKYSRAKNKAAKGRLYGASYEFLEEALGPKVAEAVSNSRSNIILEPVMGRNGYEVIKVHSLIPKVDITYENVREDIQRRLFNQTLADAMTKLEEEAKTRIKIVKSEEILKLEKEAQEYAPPKIIR